MFILLRFSHFLKFQDANPEIAFKNSFQWFSFKIFANFLQEWYDNGLQGYEVYSVPIGWTCLLPKINKL